MVMAGRIEPARVIQDSAADSNSSNYSWMVIHGCTLVTYNAMISTCEKAKNLKAAREHFAEMKGAGVEPDVITYNAMISTCREANNLEAAREHFEEMKGAGVEPNVITYSAMISTCEKANNLEAAREYSLALSESPAANAGDFQGHALRLRANALHPVRDELDKALWRTIEGL